MCVWCDSRGNHYRRGAAINTGKKPEFPAPDFLCVCFSLYLSICLSEFRLWKSTEQHLSTYPSVSWNQQWFLHLSLSLSLLKINWGSCISISDSVSLCISQENQQWFVRQHLSLLLERNPTGIHSVMFSRSRSVAVSLSLFLPPSLKQFT